MVVLVGSRKEKDNQKKLMSSFVNIAGCYPNGLIDREKKQPAIHVRRSLFTSYFSSDGTFIILISVDTDDNEKKCFKRAKKKLCCDHRGHP